jgi:CheY-like chemotaxis protein
VTTKVVLLIEDDWMVRKVVHACLEHDGYRVLDAANSQMALLLWNGWATRIALIIVDESLKEPVSGS